MHLEFVSSLSVYVLVICMIFRPLRRANPQRGGALVRTGDGENGEVGVGGYSEFVLSEMGAVPIMGLSFGGDEKRLTDLFSVIKEGRYLEDGVSVSKPKGKRELKILECSLNFDAGGSGSSRRKGKTVLRV